MSGGLAAGPLPALPAAMSTYVITEPCVSTCDTACVKVCPCDCIHGPVTPEELERLNADDRRKRVDKVQLFIDPAICIYCGLCENECPVDAIFADNEVPEQWRHYLELNAEYFSKR